MLPPGSLQCIAFHATGLYAGGKVILNIIEKYQDGKVLTLKNIRIQ